MLRKNKSEVTLGNTLVWIVATVASGVLRADMILSTVTLPGLAALGLSLTYELFE